MAKLRQGDVPGHGLCRQRQRPTAAAYRFSAHPAYVANFRAGMARLAAIRCDLLLTPHPSASKMPERFAGRLPMTDPNACQAYAATGLRNLDERLAKDAVTK